MRSSRKTILNMVLPRKKVTSKTRANTISESNRFRGSVRIALGRFYTDDEYEKRRKRILNTPLP